MTKHGRRSIFVKPNGTTIELSSGVSSSNSIGSSQTSASSVTHHHQHRSLQPLDTGTAHHHARYDTHHRTGGGGMLRTNSGGPDSIRSSSQEKKSVAIVAGSKSQVKYYSSGGLSKPPPPGGQKMSYTRSIMQVGGMGQPHKQHNEVAVPNSNMATNSSSSSNNFTTSNGLIVSCSVNGDEIHPHGLPASPSINPYNNRNNNTIGASPRVSRWRLIATVILGFYRLSYLAWPRLSKRQREKMTLIYAQHASQLGNPLAIMRVLAANGIAIGLDELKTMLLGPRPCRQWAPRGQIPGVNGVPGSVLGMPQSMSMASGMMISGGASTPGTGTSLWFRPGRVLTLQQFLYLGKMIHAKFWAESCVTDSQEAFIALGGDITDNHSYLDAAHLGDIFTRYHLMGDVSEVLRRLDSDGSGQVEYDEFKALFRMAGSGSSGHDRPVLQHGAAGGRSGHPNAQDRDGAAGHTLGGGSKDNGMGGALQSDLGDLSRNGAEHNELYPGTGGSGAGAGELVPSVVFEEVKKWIASHPLGMDARNRARRLDRRRAENGEGEEGAGSEQPAPATSARSPPRGLTEPYVDVKAVRQRLLAQHAVENPRPQNGLASFGGTTPRYLCGVRPQHDDDKGPPLPRSIVALPPPQGKSFVAPLRPNFRDGPPWRTAPPSAYTLSHHHSLHTDGSQLRAPAFDRYQPHSYDSKGDTRPSADTRSKMSVSARGNNLQPAHQTSRRRQKTYVEYDPFVAPMTKAERGN